MDGTEFDSLTRGLAAGGSRRAVLKGLVAGMFGAAVAARSAPDAAAQVDLRRPAHRLRRDLRRPDVRRRELRRVRSRRATRLNACISCR